MTGTTPVVTATGRPRPARHARLSHDRARNRSVLLGPETVVALNPTGADILRLCDGERTVAEIVGTLQARYGGDGDTVAGEVTTFLERLVARRWVEITDD